MWTLESRETRLISATECSSVCVANVDTCVSMVTVNRLCEVGGSWGVFKPGRFLRCCVLAFFVAVAIGFRLPGLPFGRLWIGDSRLVLLPDIPSGGGEMGCRGFAMGRGEGKGDVFIVMWISECKRLLVGVIMPCFGIMLWC
jgi:hypothetical protein